MDSHFYTFDDNWCDEPGFMFSEYSEKLCQILLNTKNKNFTCGIFGGYGTGKTTLMKNIASKLEAKGEITIWFDAWRYDKEPNLTLPYIYNLQERLKDKKDLVEKLHIAARAFISSTKFSFKLGPLKLEADNKEIINTYDKYLKNELESIIGEYNDVYNAIENLSSELDKCGGVFIFIDDLDRCMPNKAFDLIEALKSFFCIKGFSFILGLDPRVIKIYLKEKYKPDFPINADEYIEKIIQFNFIIPALSNQDIIGYLKSSIMKIAEVNKELANKLNTGIDEFKSFFPRNVRSIKRIFNSLQYFLTSDNTKTMSSKIILLLYLMQNKWPKLYNYFYNLPESFLSIITASKAFEKPELTNKLKLYDYYNLILDDELQKFIDKLIEAIKEMPNKSDLYYYLQLIGTPIQYEL